MAIASSLVLLVVSSVVAFNGWPDDLKGASAPPVAHLADAPAASGGPGASATTRVAALELPAAPARSDRGATRRDRAAVAGAEEQAGTPETQTSSTQPTQTASTGQPAEQDTTPAQPRRPSTQPLTDTVRETTKAVGDTVDTVVPGAGSTLESVGAAGADTVDQVGKTVDGAVQQLLP
jgi:hypothetical protein